MANHLAIVDPEGFAIVNKSIHEAINAPPPGRSAASYSASDSPGMYDPTDYTCNPFSGGFAEGLRIKYGVEYLRKVKGTPGASPGPVRLNTFPSDSMWPKRKAALAVC